MSKFGFYLFGFCIKKFALIRFFEFSWKTVNYKKADL